MPKRILLVDDDESILLSFSMIIEETGAECDVADGYEKAIALIDGYDYDAVITDIGLSGLSGSEGIGILNYVKEHKPETEVILLTGYGSPEKMDMAYSGGAAYYFEKPISFNILRGALMGLWTD